PHPPAPSSRPPPTRYNTLPPRPSYRPTVTDVVRLQVDHRGITWITLARPDVRNAFDADLIAQLSTLLGRIDPTSRAVVLRSEGDAFCAGADLNWMRGMADFSLAQN